MLYNMHCTTCALNCSGSLLFVYLFEMLILFTEEIKFPFLLYTFSFFHTDVFAHLIDISIRNIHYLFIYDIFFAVDVDVVQF